MTIGKDITAMTAGEKQKFVEARRKMRDVKEWKIRKRKAKDQTVGKLAQDLGVDKSTILGKIEEKMKEEKSDVS